MTSTLTFNHWERINFSDIIELYKIVGKKIMLISPQHEVNTYRDIYEFSHFLYKNSYTKHNDHTHDHIRSPMYDDYYIKTAQYRS
jgi:hypothetical protein